MRVTLTTPSGEQRDAMAGPPGPAVAFPARRETDAECESRRLSYVVALQEWHDRYNARVGRSWKACA